MFIPFAFMVAFTVLISLAERFFTGWIKMASILVLAGCLGFAMPSFAVFDRWDVLENNFTNHILSILLGGLIGLLIGYRIAPENHLFRYFFAKEKGNDSR